MLVQLVLGTTNVRCQKTVVGLGGRQQPTTPVLVGFYVVLKIVLQIQLILRQHVQLIRQRHVLLPLPIQAHIVQIHINV